MPPTIQNNSADRDKKPQREAERRSDLVCRVKYCNTLPDIPFDLKFINYPFESTRFIQYNPTSLERNYKYEVLTEHDLGVHIDLINRDVYQSDGYAQLDPADEKLLEEDVHTPQDSKRSRHHAKTVSWLRRSEYISTEQTRFQPQSMEKVEAKVGYNVKKSLGEETMYMDRDSQMNAIEKTFEDAGKPIEKHYSKPGVVPVEIMPVFPDFDTWKYPCAQVIFDSDPAPQDKSIAAQIEQMSQAMIRGVMDESGEQFVAYFLPTDETIAQRKKDVLDGVSYTDDMQYEYKMAREYNWNVKSKASKGYEENYFLVVRNGKSYYNELETRVRLSKRRQRAGVAGAGGPGGTRLVVKHRSLALNEHRMQRLREKQLEPPQEDDEDEADQDEEDEPMDTVEEQRNSPSQRSRSGSRASSRSRSKSSSRSRHSKSPSRSKSGSRSKSRSRSKSHSRSRSKSVSRSHSKSVSRSRSKSVSRSRSKSVSRSRSKSVSRSRSRSKSGSRSRSRSKSGSRSHSASRSCYKFKSASMSKWRSPPKSMSSSSSRSRSRSASGSQYRLGSTLFVASNPSPRKSRSVSRSGSEKSRSRSGSASPRASTHSASSGGEDSD